MPRSLSRRELIRKFRVLGFSGPHSGKRHQFMAKGAFKIRIPSPHKSKMIDGSLIARLLRQAGISEKQWDNAIEFQGYGIVQETIKVLAVSDDPVYPRHRSILDKGELR